MYKFKMEFNLINTPPKPYLGREYLDDIISSKWFSQFFVVLTHQPSGFARSAFNKL